MISFRFPINWSTRGVRPIEWDDKIELYKVRIENHMCKLETYQEYFQMMRKKYTWLPDPDADDKITKLKERAKFFMTRYILEQGSSWPGKVWSKVLHDQVQSGAKFTMTRYSLEQSSFHDKVQSEAKVFMTRYSLEQSSSWPGTVWR